MATGQEPKSGHTEAIPSFLLLASCVLWHSVQNKAGYLVRSMLTQAMGGDTGMTRVCQYVADELSIW